MKKLICAFLLGLTITGSYADTFNVKRGETPIDLYAERAVSILQKYIPDDNKRQEVIDEILLLCKLHQTTSDNHKHALELEQLKSLCSIAGWDLSKEDGIRTCEDFIKSFLSLSITEYFEVCGKDRGKTDGVDERCVNDVFFHKGTNTDTQVTMLQAVGLCKEYARIKYNDTIECSDLYRPENDCTVGECINDFVKCRSMTDAIYYEFKFDDVVESNDLNIAQSVKKMMCELYGVEYSPYNIVIEYYGKGNGQTYAEYKGVPAKCKTTDIALCTRINESAQKFALKTRFEENTCILENQYDPSKGHQLRTAFGIDNMFFKSGGHQFNAYSEMRGKLCEYIRNNADVTIATCECNYGVTRINVASGDPDDVLTCYANGEPIDFIFDDLSEGKSITHKGGLESFNCSVLGGEYQGKTCFTADRALCDKIAAATIKDCPSCKRAYFDEQQNACVLPNASDMIDHKKKVQIGLIIGGAVFGAGLVIITGGSGLAIVAVAVETAGAGMELGAQIHIDGVASEFFMKANNCDNATCAEELLKEYFQYLKQMENDLDAGEQLGVDARMAYFISLLPDDSQFLIDIVGAGCYDEESDSIDISKCDYSGWNGDQIIRAVGIVLQFTSVFGAVGKWLLSAGRVQKIAAKTSRFTQALTKKIPGVKNKIVQKLSKGERVTSFNGKIIKNTSKATAFEYLGKLKGWKVSKIETVKEVGDGINVYKFVEQGSKKTYYLKYASNIDEINRTKQAYNILGNQSGIVHIVKVIEDDQQVLIDFATKHNLPSIDGHYWFVMEEMPSEYTPTYILADSQARKSSIRNPLKSIFGGKPVTIAEQEEILRAVKKLNDNGIYHGDLMSNMTFMREPGGKLRVDIIDFETWSVNLMGRSDDIDAVNKMFKQLSEVGCAEYKIGDKGIIAVNENGVVKILNKTSQDLMSQGNSSGRVIGFLDEGFMPGVKLDDFIKDLEKEGYYVKRGADHMGKKTYEVFSNGNSSVDIEALQKQFLANATEKDRDARLAALGLYYDTEKTKPDSWYNTYKKMVTDKLLSDSEVANAQRNWYQMSEWERYKFMHQTNRKIRKMIEPNSLPANYTRQPAGAGASYSPKRIGDKVLQDRTKLENIELEGFDTYGFSPSNSFEREIENLVHENYHYTQDLGKSEMPKWLLDQNLDNYTTNTVGFIGEYNAQPLERGVKPLGYGVAKAVGDMGFERKLDEMYEIGIEIQKYDDVHLNKLGKAMAKLVENKTQASYDNMKKVLDELRMDRTTSDEILTYIKSFDNIDFWDRYRALLRQK